MWKKWQDMSPDEKREAREKTERKLQECEELIKNGVIEVMNGPRFQEWLDFGTRFHSYSTCNQMLIFRQRPSATFVAGKVKWEKEFGRHINKGEKGIVIRVPQKWKKEVETVKRDGTVETSEEEGVSFRLAYVWADDQTIGKELPAICDTLTASVENYPIILEALLHAAPCPVSFETCSFHGCYVPGDDRIIVRDGEPELQTLKTLAHEIAHSIMHKDASLDKCVKEIQAESVAYCLMRHFGLDTSAYSFEYVATWAHGKDVAELEAVLKTIGSTVSALLEKL